MNYTRPINIRITRLQYQLLVQKAGRQNKTVSCYIRNSLFENHSLISRIRNLFKEAK